MDVVDESLLFALETPRPTRSARWYRPYLMMYLAVAMLVFIVGYSLVAMVTQVSTAILGSEVTGRVVEKRDSHRSSPSLEYEFESRGRGWTGHCQVSREMFQATARGAPFRVRVLWIGGNPHYWPAHDPLYQLWIQFVILGAHACLLLAFVKPMILEPRRARALLRDGVPAWGEIVSVQTMKNDCRIEYRFCPRERSEWVTRIDTGVICPGRPEQGQQAVVFYDAESPGHSVLYCRSPYVVTLPRG